MVADPDYPYGQFRSYGVADREENKRIYIKRMSKEGVSISASREIESERVVLRLMTHATDAALANLSSSLANSI